MIDQQLEDIYACEGPIFVNVEINPEQKLYPVLKFGSALENQLPYISDEVITKEMIVALFKASDELKKNTDQKSQGW